MNLSNGESSPEHAEQANHETISFDPSIPIRAVAAMDVFHDTGSYSYRIRFMDSAGNEVYAYNPSNATVPTTTYQIGKNEELIGIYGVKGTSEWLSSFGFIVKMKDNKLQTEADDKFLELENKISSLM